MSMILVVVVVVPCEASRSWIYLGSWLYGAPAPPPFPLCCDFSFF